MNTPCQTDYTFGERQMEEYQEYLNGKGLSFITQQAYMRVLLQLYKYLNGCENLNGEVLCRWEEDLEKQGCSYSTIQVHRSIVNGFLKYLDLQEERQKESTERKQGFLTREDYLWLLQTAREHGRKRAYLLIKTLVNTGIRSLELKDLTVEALRDGAAWGTSYGMRRRIPIPEPLRTELLDYAAEESVNSGTLFVTQDGNPLLHSAVWKEIKRVCRETGLENDAGNPRCLYQLYMDTFRNICRCNSRDTAWQAYEQLLSVEETLVAWNEGF